MNATETKKMKRCNLCKQEKILIKKSHIIPDFFYRENGIYNDKHQINKIELQKYLKTKEVDYVPTGEYEGGILCKECDGEIIGSLETYGRKVLYGGLSKLEDVKCKNYVNPNDGAEFSICENVDYKRFKLFLLSILWRAAISNREVFKEAELSHGHIRRIRRMILKNDPRKVWQYPVVIISYLNDSKMPRDLILQPIRSVLKDREMVTFLIGGFAMIFNITIKKTILKKVQDVTMDNNGKLPIMHLPKGTAWDFIFKYASIK